MLHSRSVFLLVELYLGANVVGHATTGIYKSFTNKFARARLPPVSARATNLRANLLTCCGRACWQVNQWVWTGASSGRAPRS